MSTYYNEYDPGAAAWLRELMAAGEIPHGEVDERSITEVSPDDLRGHTQVHLFAGIGGWSLAARLAGWPDDRPLWTGSCPCQSFSVAGKQTGTADARHLWPDMYRLIRECRPECIAGEQVAAAIGFGWLDGVYEDLAEAGYHTAAVVLPSSFVGAPHIRSRLWWVASPGKGGVSGHATGEVGRGDPQAVSRDALGPGVPAYAEADDHAGRAAIPEGHRVGAPHLRQPLGVADAGGARGQQVPRGISREEAAHGGAGRVRGGAESDHLAASPGQDPRGLDNPPSARCQSEGKGPEGEAWDEARMRGPEPGRIDATPGGPVTPAGCTGGVGHADGERGDRGPVCLPGRGSHEEGAETPWSSAVWHPCGDGKARRIPAEPALQLVVDGLSTTMGGLWVSLLQAVKEALDGPTSVERSRESLCAMWGAVAAEAVRQDSGGPWGLSAEEVLLVALCQHARGLGSEMVGATSGVWATEEATLRVLRRQPVEIPAPPCPSPEWQRARPLARQLADAVHMLSPAWRSSLMSRFPLAHGLPGCSGLLRGCGNSIVPQVAAEVLRAFAEVMKARGNIHFTEGT